MKIVINISDFQMDVIAQKNQVPRKFVEAALIVGSAGLTTDTNSTRLLVETIISPHIDSVRQAFEYMNGFDPDNDEGFTVAVTP